MLRCLYLHNFNKSLRYLNLSSLIIRGYSENSIKMHGLLVMKNRRNPSEDNATILNVTQMKADDPKPKLKEKSVYYSDQEKDRENITTNSTMILQRCIVEAMMGKSCNNVLNA
jgi:hypothetical protein